MSPPRELTVRLRDDLNWWTDETSPRGVLDPRQVAHLVDALDAYEPYGLTREQFNDAFQVYAAESELADDQLRLVAVDEPIHHTGEQLFALPLTTADDDNPYTRFLGALGAARIRLLNTTYHYARACTETEMYDELDALDSDRYFSDDTIHVFDELNEILTWQPAEWDE